MRKLFQIFFSTVLLLSYTGLAADTDYSDPTDPNIWGGDCQTGNSQSPINIVSSSAVSCGLEQIRLSFFDGEEVLDSSGQAQTAPFPGLNIAVVNQDDRYLTYSSLQYHSIELMF